VTIFACPVDDCVLSAGLEETPWRFWVLAPGPFDVVVGWITDVVPVEAPVVAVSGCVVDEDRLDVGVVREVGSLDVEVGGTVERVTVVVVAVGDVFVALTALGEKLGGPKVPETLVAPNIQASTLPGGG
jgi:hypothetical protein